MARTEDRPAKDDDDDAFDPVSCVMLGLAGAGVAIAVVAGVVVLAVLGVGAVVCLSATLVGVFQQEVCAPLCGLFGLPVLFASLCESTLGAACGGVTGACDDTAGACATAACSGVALAAPAAPSAPSVAVLAATMNANAMAD